MTATMAVLATEKIMGRVECIESYLVICIQVEVATCSFGVT